VRLANLGGRAVVIVRGSDGVDLAVDVERASGGRFSADPQRAFDDWVGFSAWAGEVDSATSGAVDFDVRELGAPVPRPPQVFAIGVNYTEHAAEAGYPADSLPVTKFPTSIVGPDAVVELPSDVVDWEVELVVAIATECRNVDRASAWNHIAGLTIGQDLSERHVQAEGTKPQFSLAKSFPGFGPTGPWLVSVDEFENPDDLAIACALSGEVMQNGRTSGLIYTVPHLIERLSGILTLLPGDIIFTGTPAGVGNAREPKRFIRRGETLVSTIEGIGELETRFRQ
jgi:2-keto-4-pentenoate hydratase/2-oxohepta-3-ene-1,7-dioic acid hydratase in catechol pathway